MSKKSKAAIVLTVVASSVYLSGCGLLGGDEKAKIDPPSDVSYLEEGEKVDVAEENAEGEVTSSTSTEEAAENVMTELYLIDSDGYVVSQTLALPKTESVAKQALDYLVADGPVQNLLPNGFRPVLPAGTEISVNIKDGTAVADFSSEFQNYQPEDEMKILQSVTWTLTQFESVEKVELRVNGYELTEMPVNGTPIDEKGLSRKVGINVDTSGIADLTDTHPVTVYFVSQKDDNTYYVPVTKRVSNKVDNKVEAVVQQLIEGPGYQKNLLSDFTGVALLDEPSVKDDGQVTLNFNEAVYGSFEEKIVSEHFMNSLVLSLTEQEGIESVAVMVNGEGELVNEKGETLSEPVTRPENVNTISF
ncbi:sporulation protein [Rossellomorea vietnamensis]|uniref:Sporulation protein n=1 Tax=Rossellomorea vietnamensis TaxID=218284 RepID=A0A5D4MI02_9BACI|nr:MULTISPECIES: GerMN domain-containing protein [Bacillaceae]TYS00954.1 sporulation protein [Rossellomorea vietnamensis]